MSARRGFGAMDPEKHRRLSSLGGLAAHRRGVAHKWTPAEAVRAGRKGGAKMAEDRARLAELGKKGREERKRREREELENADTIPPGDPGGPGMNLPRVHP